MLINLKTFSYSLIIKILKNEKKHTSARAHIKKKKRENNQRYLPDKWAIHIVVLNNVIANIRNVAKLYSDDEIFNAGDETRTDDLCIVCLRLMFPMSHGLCAAAAAASVSFACADHIFRVNVVDAAVLSLLIRCWIKFIDFNLVVCLSFR